ncbi:MAG TPA: FtsW/RodA/SpoVE family cell cycle protein [Anaerolineaceae bacterium]|nr:FtsW/RodA/SpoVE family cell cycle protein [Anaerolineaceae bacterium]
MNTHYNSSRNSRQYASTFAGTVQAAAGENPKTTTQTLRLGIDVPLLLIVACLLAFGLLMVFSAGMRPSMLATGKPYHFFLNQIKWAILGLSAATIIMYLDYHIIRRFLLPMIGGTVLMLLLVLLIGDFRLGAQRSFFNGSVQPSELAKVAVVIYLAFWIKSKESQFNNISFGLLPLLGILGIISGLILAQPDISAAATIIMLGVGVFFFANGNFKQLMMVAILTLLFGLLVVGLNSSMSETAADRFGTFIIGLLNPGAAGDHIQRSVNSIVNGGVFGVGIGLGQIKNIGLPVAHTDSIFAVIAEETGLVGASLTVLLYIGLMWRGLKIAKQAPDLEGKLLASGLTFWIVLEALINMGVMVNLFPFAGNALPLISAGGSSLVTTLAALGIIMSVARYTARQTQTSEGRAYGAVTDLRWRDSRRRQSRARRGTSGGR